MSIDKCDFYRARAEENRAIEAAEAAKKLKRKIERRVNKELERRQKQMSDGIEDKGCSSDLVTGRRYFDMDLEVKVVYRQGGMVYEGRRSLTGRVDLTEADLAAETKGRERKYPRGGCQI